MVECKCTVYGATLVKMLGMVNPFGKNLALIERSHQGLDQWSSRP